MVANTQAQVTMYPENDKQKQKHKQKREAIAKIYLPDSIKDHKLYMSLGLGFPWTGSLHLTYLSKKDIGISINISSTLLKSANLPGDYKSVIWGFSSKPKDKFKAVSILFVKDFRAGNPKIRPGIEAGLSYFEYTENSYARQDAGAGVFIGIYQNYRVIHTINNSFGLQTRVKLEVLPTKTIGFEFALFGNFNTYRSFVGIQVLFMIGRTRERNVIQR